MADDKKVIEEHTYGVPLHSAHDELINKFGEVKARELREQYFRNQKPTQDYFQDLYVDHTLTRCGGLYEDSDFMDLYKAFDFSKALRIYKKYWLPYKSKYQDEESLKKAIDIMLHDNGFMDSTILESQAEQMIE